MSISRTTIDGLTIASEIYGQADGQPVLLLHGWGGRIESMQQVAERLASKGHYCHVIDLPGFGRSTLPAEVWGVADYARCVTHYLDQVNLKPVNLIGHSFGGRISIVLGADYPGYVQKILLADSAGVITPPTAMQQTRQAAFKAVFALPVPQSYKTRLRQWARERYGSDDLKSAGPLEPIFRRVIVEDLLPRAAKIQAPTLLIWGDQDTETPLWQGQALEKAIPDSGLVIFEGCSHFAYQERMADFVRIADTFFKGNGQ